MDPVDLAQALIRCPSVTPADEGAMDVLQSALEELGFTCHRLPFATGNAPEVQNLYARIGDRAPNFCFAGHTDVVPVGDANEWSVDPFAAEIKGDRLYGRGASDMKTAIAGFAAAAARFLESRDNGFPGSISLLITGDEEGEAVNGTVKVLEWLKEKGEVLDACLVGEPTNPETLGDMIKIGRRGSMTAFLTVHGASGHAAYPHLADNPVERLVKMLSAVLDKPLDDGTEHFQPSTTVVTTIDVGNPVANVIPARAEARINVRFNDLHTGAGVGTLLRRRLDDIGGDYDLDARVSGEPFLFPPGPLSNLVAGAVEKVTGKRPEFSTAGGTSDARFIKDHCPVCEYGMTNQTAHKADETALVSNIRLLSDIYQSVLDGFFADPG
ncbi:MAG: succinyl-diaminopimelate desuccinylase [Rhodospirillales bacterium]|nr:succinyl-diaminopimelate desuccinylase [Rhodospirillales bacterium]